ncbi:TorD/DmsD family molecular chaperone [Novisyntrophococcus fermenticellae]|uniref:TorD/DmsD family molecular chaperone n=1 Tax=Novisyntrophococcus fermenticellae TaxID=2068655 RepID=UPI001E550AE2|nr:molecular chaperone TorD family protein [Novisyntrophococcus fermenticellae]
MEIDKLLMEHMKSMEFPIVSSETELSEGYSMIQNYLRNSKEESLTDLAVDYAKVFLGAGATENSAAYPYESVYTSSKRIMMQEARDEVLDVYKSKRLVKDNNIKALPEDHVSLELEFMAFLCEEALSALDLKDSSLVLSSLTEQRDFLDRHMLNWIHGFCYDIAKYADTEFYKGVGKVTNAFLHLDRSNLDYVMSYYGLS